MTAIYDEDWQAVAREDWGGASEEDPITSIKLVHDGEARRFGVALVFFDGDAGPATWDYEFAALRAHVEDTFPSATIEGLLTGPRPQSFGRQATVTKRGPAVPTVDASLLCVDWRCDDCDE